MQYITNFNYKFYNILQKHKFTEVRFGMIFASAKIIQALAFMFFYYKIFVVKKVAEKTRAARFLYLTIATLLTHVSVCENMRDTLFLFMGLHPKPHKGLVP